MADFFPLISRAVKLLPDPATRTERDAIYNKARSALLKQLRSVEPALAQETIDKELTALETSIEQVEKDLNPIETETDKTDIKTEILVQDNILETETLKSTLRPRVPLADAEKSERKKVKRNLVLAAGLPIALGVMTVTGLLAWNNKQKPEDFTLAPKTVSSNSKPSSTITVAEGKQSAKTIEQTAEQTIPVAVRASFFEEDPVNPQSRIERRGAIVWRLEMDTPDQNGVSIPRIRGNMEFPDARLNAEFLLRRNLDTSFPASHTADLRFLATSLDAKTVKSIALPEFRAELLERGPTLQAVKAPDIDNIFLIALLNTEPFQSTNIELLKKSGWFFFETRFTDGKRGELVFEKGIAGENAFSEAFLAWKQ